jgi:polar amino acid transport system substrate-binding protein
MKRLSAWYGTGGIKRAGPMRFLLYVNMVAIVLLAGALARLYEGEPLPWLEQGERGAIAEAPVEPGPAVTGPAEPNPAETPAEPSAPLTIEQMMALQLPLPNPARMPAEPEAGAEPEPPREIVILTEGAYPPFNYRDGSGALSGFDVELARALCENIEVHCTFAAKPWDRLVPVLAAGEGDAVIASMLIPAAGRESPASSPGLILSDRYYSTPGHFAARRNAVPLAATPSALAGRSIAVQAGSIHQAYVSMRFPDAKLEIFPSLEAAQQALAEGKAHLLFADRNMLLRWSASPDGACCRLVGPAYGDAAYFGKGAAIVLRKGDEKLRDDFNVALAALIADGTYARISSGYFSGSIY